MMKINLNKDWDIRGEELSVGINETPNIISKTKGWMRADIPCDIHMPLIENDIIKEPLIKDNCYKCEWTEEKSWWFKKEFIIDNDILTSDIVEITFESLDAKADIFLNDYYLGNHASANYPFTKEVKDKLKKGSNIILVRLSSGLEYFSQNDICEFSQSINIQNDSNDIERGDKRRIMVRKPQYVYGWDWGPRVATCGIVKDVYIKAYNKATVRNVRAITTCIDKTAHVEYKIEIENFHPYSTIEGDISVELFYKGKKVTDVSKETILRSGINYIDLNMDIEDPKLWWPNGMGKQNLYTVRVLLETKEAKCEYEDFKIALRTIELNLEKINENERLFAFIVNGKDVFCKGGNWVPADSIYARVSDDKYDTLVKEAKEANFNMLRIWGGGIYEKDIFYDKCDEYGILIWHDFMFACALYPDNLSWFKDEIEKEMDYQTKRLRNHASMALWCGNNENHWGFDEWWVNENRPKYLGGVKCYNSIAPRIIEKNCPNIPYWNSSPYGGEHPNGNNVGDRHHWHDCTMNSDVEKRITPEEYDKVTSKFVSEYGYIGPCVKSSIEKYHGSDKIDKNGNIWQLHNNQFEKETVPAGIKKHYADPENLGIDKYLLYASLCQGLMLRYSLEAIRFVQNCNGSLFWMYNDCWGEVGWTIIDYYLKRKPSFYFVKRAFSPVNIILREKEGIVKVMGVNDTLKEKKYVMEYGYISFDGKIEEISKETVTLKPCSKSIVFEFKKPSKDYTKGICFVRTNDENGPILSATLRSKDIKELSLPQPKFVISDLKINKDEIEFKISCSNFAHGVHFDMDESINVSDEYFDMLPGEKRKIRFFAKDMNISVKDIKPKSIVL